MDTSSLVISLPGTYLIAKFGQACFTGFHQNTMSGIGIKIKKCPGSDFFI